MIQVNVKKRNESITGFHIEGHSGYAEHGSDIVCAAISALAVNCVNSVEELTQDRFSVESDERRGMIDFQLEGEPSGESQLLLHSLLLGVRGISEKYGSRYIALIHC